MKATAITNRETLIHTIRMINNTTITTEEVSTPTRLMLADNTTKEVMVITMNRT